jgi:hypothetical protein
VAKKQAQTGSGKTPAKAPASITFSFTHNGEAVTETMHFVRDSARGLRYEFPADSKLFPAHMGKGPRSADRFPQDLYLAKAAIGMKVDTSRLTGADKNGPVKTTPASVPAQPRLWPLELTHAWNAWKRSCPRSWRP